MKQKKLFTFPHLRKLGLLIILCFGVAGCNKPNATNNADKRPNDKNSVSESPIDKKTVGKGSTVKKTVSEKPKNEIRFPKEAKVINVVTDRGVDNTGKTDVTEKLNAIYKENKNFPQIIYFPKGTYLVSGRIRGMHLEKRTGKPGRYKVGPFLIGESRTETIIRLKDGTWPKDPFTDIDSIPKSINEQVVLHAGEMLNTTFRQIIHNLTVNIGKNNAGATGIVYMASNDGTISNVDIISEDGKGSIGLALTGLENGPALVQDVKIEGFERGIYGRTHYQLTLSDIKVKSNGPCLINNKGKLVIEDLDAQRKTAGPAVISNYWLTLVGGSLKGNGDTAIINEGHLYARNTKTVGFKRALEVAKEDQLPAPDETKITEYYSFPRVGAFKGGTKSLGLEIKKTPFRKWETDFSKWTNILDFKNPDTSWASAFQQAIDSPGKTHVVLPINAGKSCKHYTIDEDVYIRGDVSRVVGTAARFGSGHKHKGNLIIEDGTAPVVTLENFLYAPSIIIRTDRTVVLNTISMKRNRFTLTIEGGGEVFLNTMYDVPVIVNNPKARVYARQFNNETKTFEGVDIKQGEMWILGWKSENLGPRAKVGKGAQLEIFGLSSSEVGKDKAPKPAFIVEEGGKLSVANFEQHGPRKYSDLVKETQVGKTRTLKIKDNKNKSPHASFISAGY